MKKIIVTGATGFIGRRLITLLVKKYGKSNVICLIKKSDTSYEKEGRKVLSNLGVKTTFIDLDDGSGLVNLPQNISHVFHLAAKTDTSESGHDKTNFLGTKILVEALNGNAEIHFIYTSTTAFFSGRQDCRKPINEKSTPAPTNEYGKSKLASEKYLINLAEKGLFKLTVVRFPTVYGPNPRKNSFFDILNELANKQSLASRINWPGKTSLIHVDDAAKFIFKLSQRKNELGKANLYIASSESLNLNQINEMIFDAKVFPYNLIKLPKVFWRTCAFLRKHHGFLEYLLPGKIYNSIWRFFLLVDDVIYCDSKKLLKTYYGYKAKMLEDTINTLLPREKM